VHALNAALRRVLMERGALGPEEVLVRTLHRDGRHGDVRDLALRVGDELVVWRRVPGHDLNNGDRIRVLGWAPGMEAGDVALTWRTEKTGLVTTAPLSSLEAPSFPDDPAGQPRLPYLQHAYAVTMHAAQSRTVDRGFVYGGIGLDARSAYVALTRHRDDARVYWDRGAIAQGLAEEGERPSRAAIVEHIRREARRSGEALSVLDFVADADAWLATGDVAAERPRPSGVAARMTAAAQAAAVTIQRAAMEHPDQVAALARAAATLSEARPRARPPRTDPAVRAAAAYAREAARIREAAVVRDRRATGRVDAVVQALRRPGGVGRLVEALREVPRRFRADLRRSAARAAPAVGEALTRWSQGWTGRERAAQLDARRAEIAALGGTALRGVTALAASGGLAPSAVDQQAWTERWLWRSRLGPYAPGAPVLGPPPTERENLIARLPPLPARIVARLDDRALAALAHPAPPPSRRAPTPRRSSGSARRWSAAWSRA
jgi:hypothetical protein